MKEWKKPFVKCVLLDDSDLITTSDPDCPKDDDPTMVGLNTTQNGNNGRSIFGTNPWQ